jgi:hypothetical protein
MSKSTDTYTRLVNALLAHPKAESKPPVTWPRNKTLRVTSTHRRPNESEWMRRLALS